MHLILQRLNVPGFGGGGRTPPSQKRKGGRMWGLGQRLFGEGTGVSNQSVK